MALVGFSFTKIIAEKKSSVNRAVNIESNASVTNIIELPVIEAKKMLLKFEFIFTVKYEPSAGKIELTGEVVQLYDKEFGVKVMDQWTKEKKVLGDVMQEIFNQLLSKSNIQAIVLSRDIGLPSPIQMPRVDVKPKDKSKNESTVPKTEVKSKSEKAKK